VEPKSISAIALWSISSNGMAGGGMSSCQCLIRLTWLAVVVAWAFQAAYSQEPGRGPDAGERVAGAGPSLAPGPSLALSDLARSDDSQDDTGRAPPSSPGTMQSICLLVESAAQAHGLPLEFFARLIWQESRFMPDAVGPATHRGQRAQGIAQFMPEVAKTRGVVDPFDPVAALPKSAEFLRELRAEFGNLGLAAAAYNAGSKRVREWLAGHGSLPLQTRNYVSAITGRSAKDWAAATRRHGGSEELAPANHTSCGDLIALLKAQPVSSADGLGRRVSDGAALPWGVQLRAGFERDHVLDAYASVEKSHQAILDRRIPIIIKSTLRNRGTQPFYQMRIGADTRASAEELCRTLRKAGGVCMVLRNPELSPQSL
jgi:Transglycosylase SLT domain